ncbi:MAG: metallophosphoesterase [Bacteroidetes bacterium]|nr:metallophosphoesterase [Bacteroidota bacterium]
MKTRTRSLISSLVIMSFLFLLNTGCKKKDSKNTATGKDVYTIAVISDIHYMDPSLWCDTSTAFKIFVTFDQRLPAESDAIMREVVQELINAKPKPDLVLIPGDLSFDGELVSHNKVAVYLSELTSAGIKVRVIDGNHDINFRYAVSYLGYDTVPVANILPSDFKRIYTDFGYSDAISLDPASLSYVSEPLPGLWLLSIDACIYDKDLAYATTGGGNIRQATMTWALARLAEAAAKGKTVFGMMHHALVNHFTDQDLLYQYNVVQRSTTVSDSLMNGGLKLMFTGHGHSTDIVKKTSGNKFLYDIETSSTVAYPCTYRMITYIKDSALIISTIPITHIDFPIPAGLTFQAYAEQRIQCAVDTDNAYFYTKPPYNYKPDTAWRLARRMARALMAQMAGDEQILSTSEYDSIEPTINLLGAGFLPIRTNWLNLWNDLEPADNSLVIFLKSGASYKK